MLDWSEFDNFNRFCDLYMPVVGEGETKASQIVTAVSKLVYKWFNDGDVYDTTTGMSTGNDLSSYANWLYKYTDAAGILEEIYNIYTEEDYTLLLYELSNALLKDDYLLEENQKPKVDSIYTCEGAFMCPEEYYEEDEYYSW